MINYEYQNSSFFLANKEYCEKTEHDLQSFNITCSGFCNSFGYEIVSEFERSGLKYKLFFERHQTTQNGVVWPVSANDYAGLELNISGLGKSPDVKIGYSKLKRLFGNRLFNKLVPGAAYLITNSELKSSFIELLSRIMIENKAGSLKINKGRVVFKIHNSEFNLINLLDSFKNLTNELKQPIGK